LLLALAVIHKWHLQQKLSGSAVKLKAYKGAEHVVQRTHMPTTFVVHQGHLPMTKVVGTSVLLHVLHICAINLSALAEQNGILNFPYDHIWKYNIKLWELHWQILWRSWINL
jgi:hypothetical protein